MAFDKKTQQMRFSEKELSLIKSTFAENEALLKAVRKVFLQLPLTDREQKKVTTAFKDKPAIQALVEKCFLPRIDGNAPFYQVIDLYMTVDIKDKTPMDAMPNIIARIKLVEYLTQQLTELFTGEKGLIFFTDLLPSDEKEILDNYVDMTMRNTLIGHIEQQIHQLWVLAGMKTETVEETTLRLKKDSMQ